MTESNGNGFLSRDALLKRTERVIAEVEIPGAGKVRIRSLTEGERARYEASLQDRQGRLDSKKSQQLRARLIALCLVDAKGHCEFHEADIPKLMKIDCRTSVAIHQACAKHNGFDDEDLELMVKNSEETDGDDSPSV